MKYIFLVYKKQRKWSWIISTDKIENPIPDVYVPAISANERVCFIGKLLHSSTDLINYQYSDRVKLGGNITNSDLKTFDLPWTGFEYRIYNSIDDLLAEHFVDMI